MQTFCKPNKKTPHVINYSCKNIEKYRVNAFLVFVHTTVNFNKLPRSFKLQMYFSSKMENITHKQQPARKTKSFM